MKKGSLGGVVAALLLVFLAFYNLSDYPAIWFDEGVHLHVPQTLVRYGEYADRSSDGFRYFGPTLGVGPTVMLPIAAVYKVLGIGLLQARVVMALYLLAALYVFYRLALQLGGKWFAVAALAFLVSSPGVAMAETGRQVLGEVPGLFFLSAGLVAWFAAWDGARGRLIVAGLFFGAAAITKYQNLIVLVPAIGIAATLNLVYYRAAPFRVFLWPGVVMAAMFGLWQSILVVYLGPATSAENLAALREATAGAAAVFSPDAMKRAVRELLSFKAYGGALVPALAYGFFCAVPRSREGQRWGIVGLLVTVNIGWYVVASIGWPRYAFAGLAFASLLVTKFFIDALQHLADAANARADSRAAPARRGLQGAIGGWAVFILVASLAATVPPVLAPPENFPRAMSEYLDQQVEKGVRIETWEQELGALTTHNYHYPPPRLLNVAVRHIWLGGPSPSLQYKPLDIDPPPYVVVGEFARWVGVYPADALARSYALEKKIGAYELYRRVESIAPPASGS